MNVKEIREVINLMNENNLTEIEIERDGMKIKLKKASYGASQDVFLERTPMVAAPQVPTGAPAPTTEIPAKDASADKNLIEIKAPLVGTFYRAPSPESDPFIEVGQNIEVGQVVCIVEAMKLMNEIKSEVRGKVVDILAENADPVEFGQILILIDPS